MAKSFSTVMFPSPLRTDRTSIEPEYQHHNGHNDERAQQAERDRPVLIASTTIRWHDAPPPANALSHAETRLPARPDSPDACSQS
jgi:hypothetical protein